MGQDGSEGHLLLLPKRTLLPGEVKPYFLWSFDHPDCPLWPLYSLKSELKLCFNRVKCWVFELDGDHLEHQIHETVSVFVSS